MRRFKARRCYKDRVLMPTINCLLQCVNLEELYLEKADSPAITTYLLAHILKSLTRLRVLALPKQSDDDVASVVGLNCPKLECIILTGTAVTNVGLSWLLCCRQLHTLIMPGFFQGVTPKGNYSMHFAHYQNDCRKSLLWYFQHILVIRQLLLFE